MTIKKNEGLADRISRSGISVVGFIYAFFWLGGWAQVAVAGVSVVLLGTAVVGFCGAYRLLGIDTCRADTRPPSKVLLGTAGLVLIAFAVLGSYASHLFTKRILLEDFNAMNQFYKQALFFTGQEKREEASANYAKLVSEYDSFRRKYQRYHPFVVSSDARLNDDLDRVAVMIAAANERIVAGELTAAHLDLERVRPVFQEIFKRNGFSMLAVFLVDFHDAMEKIVDAADSRDSARVLAAYPEADRKLATVEEVANDAEVQSIRRHLEQLAALAREGPADALSAKAEELKREFVKVYLKRG